MTKEPLKSEIRHSPPQLTRLVSTPLDTAGGAPGTMKDSTFASQVPATSLNIACSGPGLGSGGICGGPAGAAGLSCARARPAKPARPTTAGQAKTNVSSLVTSELPLVDVPTLSAGNV